MAESPMAFVMAKPKQSQTEDAVDEDVEQAFFEGSCFMVLQVGAKGFDGALHVAHDHDARVFMAFDAVEGLHLKP